MPRIGACTASRQRAAIELDPSIHRSVRIREACAQLRQRVVERLHLRVVGPGSVLDDVAALDQKRLDTVQLVECEGARRQPSDDACNVHVVRSGFAIGSERPFEIRPCRSKVAHRHRGRRANFVRPRALRLGRMVELRVKLERTIGMRSNLCPPLGERGEPVRERDVQVRSHTGTAVQRGVALDAPRRVDEDVVQTQLPDLVGRQPPSHERAEQELVHRRHLVRFGAPVVRGAERVAHRRLRDRFRLQRMRLRLQCDRLRVQCVRLRFLRAQIEARGDGREHDQCDEGDGHQSADQAVLLDQRAQHVQRTVAPRLDRFARERVAQVPGQLAHGRVAPKRLLRQAAQHDRLDVRVHVAADARQRFGQRVLDGLNDIGDGSADVVGQPTGDEKQDAMSVRVRRVVVHRTWDPHLRRSLAMKVCGVRFGTGWQDVTDPDDARRLAHFLQEAQLTAQLDHPGILPVHDLGLRENGDLFYTMRLVRGRTMADVFDEADLAALGSARERAIVHALGILLRACEAVAYAHAKGVVHRDLKPSNVMVGEFGEVYVVDWGLAKLVEQFNDMSAPEVRSDLEDASRDEHESPLRTQEGSIVGTLDFMSPEQAFGTSHAGPRTDVYAMGAILYRLLSGVPAFAEVADHGMKLHAIRSSQPKPIDAAGRGVSPELAAICRRAMEREPGDRYRDVAGLADDIRAYLEDRVVAAYERGVFAEARKWILRNRALSTIGALALLLGVAGIALWRWGASNQEQYRYRDDAQRLESVRKRSAILFPPTAANAPNLRTCLDELETLLSRLPSHESDLADLRAHPEARALGDDWIFDDDFLQWQHDALAGLVRNLTSAAMPNELLLSGAELPTFDVDPQLTVESERSTTSWDSHWGLRDALVRRSAQASAGADPDQDRVDAWTRAIDSIANSLTYDRLSVGPQDGLVPVGRDPQSGLWEFAVVGTGASIPERDSVGQLKMEEDSTVVMVLVPAGDAILGTDRIPGDLPRPLRDFLPAPDPSETPRPSIVGLRAFFLSKFEMTQAQWRCMTGASPSVRGDEFTASYPVEMVSWEQCTALLDLFGLCLPTEAQWEFCARVFSEDLWWCGNDPACLADRANLLDVEAQRLGEWSDKVLPPPGWEDPFYGHCDVRELDASPLGLHHMNGNVWEWCRDYFGPYEAEAALGDGLRAVVQSSNERVFRGGSFLSSVLEARSAYRNMAGPAFVRRDIGVRPARVLQP